MNLTSIKIIKSLCKQYNFWPRRESGQNFLINKEVLDKIIQSSDLKKDDVVLEIGAGFGTLTFELAKFAKKVIACELDKRLVKALKNVQDVQNVKNVQIVEGDIFKQWSVVSSQLIDLKYKLISNLPYNITSLVLRSFLEVKPRPKEMILLIQKEVAERIVSKPGEMSLLSVMVQFYAKPEIVSFVPRKNFWPEPEVDSTIIKIEGLTSAWSLRGDGETSKFFRVVKAGFSAKRKQLHNNLSVCLKISDNELKKILRKLDLDEKIRAQDLSIQDWINLTKILL